MPKRRPFFRAEKIPQVPSSVPEELPAGLSFAPEALGHPVGRLVPQGEELPVDGREDNVLPVVLAPESGGIIVKVCNNCSPGAQENNCLEFRSFTILSSSNVHLYGGTRNRAGHLRFFSTLYIEKCSI